jgi:glycosyltransferase involved in cell wall biosynthesis
MKVLVLIHEFPPVGGGGGRAAQDICRGLVDRGHAVAVLTAHLKGLPEVEMIDGVTVQRLASLRREAFRAGLLAMGAYVLAGVWAGFRLVRRWRPDVVHVHFAVPAGAAAWALRRLTGVPYLMTVHLGDVPGGVPEKTGGWFKWAFPFTRPIWRGAGRVVAVSEYTRQLARLQPGNIQVQDPPRVVFAGRLMAQKNPLQIVRTLAGLKELAWQCVLVGDGPLMPDVRREIEAHGLQARFTLTGWVAPEEVLAWFDRSDILFMPSLSEGLPVVGVQALAKGLAVVASKVGGFVDLVDDGENGFLVDLADPSRFAAVLRQLLADKTGLKRFREASLKKAVAFDLVRVVEGYERILLALTATN